VCAAAGRWRGRLVAIKVLRPAFPGDAAAELASFRREVRVLSRLQHARIVSLLGAAACPHPAPEPCPLTCPGCERVPAQRRRPSALLVSCSSSAGSVCCSVARLAA